MNNQTKSIISPPVIVISLGHLASILSLFLILIIILVTLFLLFTKKRNNFSFDENELPSEISISANERKSFQFRQFKQYLSTTNTQSYPSISSFQMDIDEQNTGSTINLLSLN